MQIRRRITRQLLPLRSVCIRGQFTSMRRPIGQQLLVRRIGPLSATINREEIADRAGAQ